jgi:purine-cytosine permease-like protein
MAQTAPVEIYSPLRDGEIMRRTFGGAGATCVGLLLALVTIGWWTVQTELFANTAIELLTRVFHLDPPRQLVVVIGGLFMISIAAVAVRTSGRLAPLAPFLIAGLCYLEWRMQDLPVAQLGSIALVLIMFATWIVNLCNLQCSALGLVSVFPAGRRGQLTMTAGLIGTILAELHFSSLMVSPLVLAGMLLAPAAGIIFVTRIIITRMNQNSASSLRMPPGTPRAERTEQLVGSSSKR